LKVAICARGIAALALIETNRDMNQRLQEQSARPAFGSSRKCVWLIVFTSSTRAWAEMHETAFGRGSIHKTPLTCGVFSSRTYSSEWTPLRGSIEKINRFQRYKDTVSEPGADRSLHAWFSCPQRCRIKLRQHQRPKRESLAYPTNSGPTQVLAALKSVWRSNDISGQFF
jgi:hypothetical protein